jgi:hypothetical protein
MKATVYPYSTVRNRLGGRKALLRNVKGLAAFGPDGQGGFEVIRRLPGIRHLLAQHG